MHVRQKCDVGMYQYTFSITITLGLVLFTTAINNFASITLLIQGAHTLSRNKLPGNHHKLSWKHSRAVQCKQAAYTPILTILGKDRHVYVCT